MRTGDRQNRGKYFPSLSAQRRVVGDLDVLVPTRSLLLERVTEALAGIVTQTQAGLSTHT